MAIVEATWIDSVSPAATGNKIYRDDVEIADIANGIQIYTDNSAPDGANPKYEVQAHDGAGDETTQEVIGVNTQYIETSGGVDYLLDIYTGSSVAYSFRKLKSDATLSVQVRRDNNDALTDVLLDNTGSLTLSSTVSAGGTLGTWVGANSAYVRTWYDQSGNANNATQTTNAAQPRLINVGVLEVENGLATLRYLGAEELNVASVIYNSTMSIFNVWTGGTSAEGCLYNFGDGVSQIAMSYNRSINILNSVQAVSAVQTNKSIIFVQNTQYLTSTLGDGGTSNYLYLNQAVDTGVQNGRSDPAQNTIGSRGALYYHIGTIQEVVAYQSDESANRTAIEDDINNHYSIWVATAQVDAQLIQADLDGLSNTILEINGVRSSASDVAVANLIGRGVTVITR